MRPATADSLQDVTMLRRSDNAVHAAGHTKLSSTGLNDICECMCWCQWLVGFVINIVRKKGDDETKRHIACGYYICGSAPESTPTPVFAYKRMLQDMEADIMQCCIVSRLPTFDRFLQR